MQSTTLSTSQMYPYVTATNSPTATTGLASTNPQANVGNTAVANTNAVQTPQQFKTTGTMAASGGVLTVGNSSTDGATEVTLSVFAVSATGFTLRKKVDSSTNPQQCSIQAAWVAFQ